MTAEEWRRIAGFPDYYVSSFGRVVSKRRKNIRVLLGGHNQRGYHMVQLWTPDGTVVGRTVHRLVALTFLGPPPDGMQVRHLDGDKTNNRLPNLAYGTASENILDQVAHGVHHMARKTHCPRGHPYDDENTYIIPSTGGRMCLTCPRLRRAAGRAA